VPATAAASARWCGDARRRDDARHAVFPHRKTIKVIYAYPRGRPNRLRYWAPILQADVGLIQRFVATQSFGAKTVRFDMGTRCGGQFVDIQMLRLRGTWRRYLDRTGDPTVDPGTALHREIARATRGERRHNFVVFADGLNRLGPREPMWAWGQTDVLVGDDRPGPENRNNRPGRIAAVFGPSRGLPARTAAGFASEMMLHEILHTLGAVQPESPHATSGGHCFDGADIMCYDDGSARARRYSDGYCPEVSGEISQALDCSRQDYFNPDPLAGSFLATHWNVFDSAFLGECADPALQAACAAPAAAAAAAGGPAATADIVAPDGTVLGRVRLSLDVGDTTATARVSSTPIEVPPGFFRSRTCVSTSGANVAPWSNCWPEDASTGQPVTAQAVTVTRAFGQPSQVSAWIEIQVPDGGGYRTIAASTPDGATLPVAGR
jgi:hypothetical protein